MSIPTYDRFIEPLLRYLAEHPDGVRASDAHEVVASRLGLTPADKAERLPSGTQLVYKNRNGWAHDRLKRAGFSTSPRHGFWTITRSGSEFATKNKNLSDSALDGLALVERGVARLKPKKSSSDEPAARAPVLSTPSEAASPRERIEAALAELGESVARDLLENIARSPPEFFEKLVLDLLHRMGYGMSRSDLKRVGGSGDGGIDGIISLDRLGLEKVYVQAKRWTSSTVGGPEVQTFMGALQLQGASKGVLITTSTFTNPAVHAATQARGAVVLIDGARLTELMIDHGVAVQTEAIKIPSIDNDYFEDG